MNEFELYEFLDQLKISYQRIEHPAVYTVEQANHYLMDAPGTRTKNLFICDEKKREYYILWVHSDHHIHFNQLGRELHMGKPRFGSPEKLKEYLGLEPGSVSVLALVNDVHLQVNIIVDSILWQCDSFQCHPLVNTATLVISKEDISRFFELIGHTIQIIDVPKK